MKDILSNVQNIDELNAIKENFEIEFNTQVKRINNLNKLNEINNGGFVLLTHLFEGLLNKLMESKEGGKIINNFIKIVKSDKILKENFIFTKEVLGKQDISVINEGFSLIAVDNKVVYNKSLNKLRGVVVEAFKYLNEDIDINEVISKLSSAFDFKITNKKTLKNINEHVINENIIKNYCNIQNNNSINISENVNIDIIASLLDNNLSSEDCFKNKVNECVSKIDGMGDNVDKELLTIKEKLLIKEYNEDTFDVDMENLINLSEIINK